MKTEIFDYVWRGEGGYTGHKMLNMQLPQRRKKGSPQRRFMDVMKKDTVGATEDEAEADDPLWRKKNKIVTKPS